MSIIDIKDGGLDHNEQFNVTVGVIHFVVQQAEGELKKITGYCKPEAKQDIIKTLKEQIVWEQPHA